MTGLRIAPGLTLPPEIITDTIAIFGTRGSGKSTSGTVIVEEAHALNLPTVVLDPKGDWWGLRSSAEGKAGGGLPFIIFGGDHADVPLEPTAGVLLADLIVDQRINAVLDLSAMSKTGQRRFAMDFAERLYRRNREALLVVVDEADIVIPQRVSADMLRLLGAWEDIAKRGRGRGLGLCVLTQRPQDVAKSVLDEMHALLLHGMVGPRAMKSIREWVDNHADEGAPTAEILGSLGSLEPGEGWMWAPFRHIRQRIRVRRIHTFDSHATPKPGQLRAAPRARAQVDLESLGAQIAATVERAKAEDPRELRRQVADLERQVTELHRQLADVEPVVERVEVPVLPEDVVQRVEATFDRLSLAYTEWAEQLGQVTSLTDESIEQINMLRAVMRSAVPPVGAKQGTSPDRSSAPVATRPDVTRGSRVSGTPNPQERPAARVRETRPSLAAGTSDVRLGKTERTILAVLAEHGPRTHSQLALLSGYSAKASTIGVALGKLRGLGYVAAGQPITATPEGIDWLGAGYKPLPQGDALLEYWRNRFGVTERNVLDAFLAAYPYDTTQAEVAEITGYSATASTIGVSLGKLRKVGVVDRWRISEDFADAVGLGGAR